ncbi:MAG: NAD-dependent malic enzyme [Proteobacteria bacterium]|nr:NAD-dependent malic enzyme [Pseudomonadota bacterium]MBU4469200.1 NAD-dependent malic enzyme [Pseudomonadota bacterium]MCG2752231.1 NAD-dependent malic enzyme [Desulfobacteraceae bacterium]
MTGTKFDLENFPKGTSLLRNSLLNKGTAFTEEERDALGLMGLLPPRVTSQETQLVRVLGNIRRKESDLEKYIFLTALQDRNEALFTRLLLENLDEMLPIVYTPTVGKACLEYGHIFRRPRGLFLSAKHRGKINEILKQNWPNRDVRAIVVTDGERILGLGDLGVDGMGIPIGKLSLYTACGGIHPGHCLPVILDVGTNNEALLKDPLYIGMQHRRLTGEKYDELVHEFVMACHEVFAGPLIQFEDFGNRNAFRLLKRYKDKVCSFNDDIQGTAAVALGGLYAALRITKQKLEDQKILFLGAGEAGTGIGELIVSAMVEQGLPEIEARKRCWFVDSKGLIVQDRKNLSEHKIPFAQDHPFLPDFLSAVEALEPTAIIGASGQPGAFTKAILEAMARIHEQPIVFALSNPTSMSECTAEEAYTHTQGRCIFAGGSPFTPVAIHGRIHVPGQGNNVYIFPGIGLGAISCRIKHVIDEMFLAAAKTLAARVTETDLAKGSIYPPLTGIREVSLDIATAISQIAYARGLAEEPEPSDIKAFLKSKMYDPRYEVYV